MSNDEPIAIVTGADSGIGLAIANKFAEAEKIGKREDALAAAKLDYLP